MIPLTLAVFDVLLLVLSLTRIYRLVWTDYLGEVFILRPAEKVFQWLEDRGRDRVARAARIGFECPFCLGFWIGLLWLAALILSGGPGEAALWWRLTAGALALNWAASHIAGRSGDL